MCLRCIDGFIDLIHHKKSIIDNISHDDVSYKCLHLMSWMIKKKSFFLVSNGPCCAFTQSLRGDVRQTTVKPAHLPTIISARFRPDTRSVLKDVHSKTTDSDVERDDDDMFIVTSRKQDLLKLRRGISRYLSDETSSDDLHIYHESPTKCTYNGILQLNHRPVDTVSDANRKSLRRAKRTIKKKSTVLQHCHPHSHNIYQGALIMFMFGLGIQADTFHGHWYADHMALALSEADGTPSVGHCVLSESCSDSIFRYMSDNRISPRKIEGTSRRVHIMLPSPEDPSKYRSVWVHIYIVKQVLTANQCLDFAKGSNSHSNKYLSELNMFSQNDIRKDVDYTIILGDFTKETRHLPYKLLLIRPTSMLCNHKFSHSEKSILAEHIYHTLRSYCGKRGYEMRRVCGSSGLVTAASDRDIISVLHENEGALPRKVYAVIILRGSDRYYLVYRRVNPSIGECSFTSTYYCPPKDGGAFKMPKVCSSTFFPLADLTYNKMMAIMLLEQINILFKIEGDLSVAEGPLRCELVKINKARMVYNQQSTSTRMHHLIVTFNSYNNFSMVGYPSGYHFDHYYDQESEYIENKILFSISSLKNSIGRGGHILGKLYVYALLDWGTKAKKTRAEVEE